MGVTIVHFHPPDRQARQLNDVLRLALLEVSNERDAYRDAMQRSACRLKTLANLLVGSGEGSK